MQPDPPRDRSQRGWRELLLWPLGERPVTLKPGASTEPLVLYAHERHEAMVQRGDCLYTYPAPDYFALPEAIKSYKPVTFVIHEDMRLSLHRRSNDGVEGPAIEVAGFPLTPTTFCGRPGQAYRAHATAARDAVEKEALRRAGIGYVEVVGGEMSPSELRQVIHKLVQKVAA